MHDLGAIAVTDGMDPSDATIVALAEEEEDEFCAAQIALLGKAGFEQLRQFEDLQSLQNQVEFSVGFGAGFPPAPLTCAQRRQLATVLANASDGLAGRLTIDWNAVLPQAQGILSGPQLEGLKAASYRDELEWLRRQFFQGDSRIE